MADDDVKFEFLSQLPKDNLDDRTFEDLVAECILRIPRYCPEWTDYNASDPGITLIELFAWLTDQMLNRFNRVPRRNYITFLELLGIRLKAPAAAQTELVFYLTQPDTFPYIIPRDTEVGTVRTQTEEAIIFSTDRDLVIDQPVIRHILTSTLAEETPQSLRDPVSNQWTRHSDGSWEGNELPLFEEQPQAGNCFYLVFEPDQSLDGNVIAISFRGQAATPTGIDPDNPPRQWHAWDGGSWRLVLRQESDDQTQGFSFNELTQSSSDPIQEADVVLHLPEIWSVTNFTGYEGRWLRCTHVPPEDGQPGYLNAPLIIRIGVRAVGGLVPAHHSTVIRDELLGTSDGTPGQQFQLRGAPVLERRADEYLVVSPLGELPQAWQEVADFGDSGSEDRHYALDSITGMIQFGPLIREPYYHPQHTAVRSAQSPMPQLADYSDRRFSHEVGQLERQYGSIPPRGAEVRMRAYRTGGGKRGNVERRTLRVMKSSLPYVSEVINYEPARGGADEESLSQAVLRAPKMLRTRNRAVTREDYETLTLEGGRGEIARALCLSPEGAEEAGSVSILVVPSANIDSLAQGDGLPPELLRLTPQLREQVLNYLNDRKLLGTQIRLMQPHLVGVAVELQVGLEPTYRTPQAQMEFRLRLENALYYFLNPLVGGLDKQGWSFGRPLYISDIVALVQQTPGVRYLGPVLLYELQLQGQTWRRRPDPMQLVDPGPTGLLCSWRNRALRSSHVINFLEG